MVAWARWFPTPLVASQTYVPASCRSTESIIRVFDTRAFSPLGNKLFWNGTEEKLDYYFTYGRAWKVLFRIWDLWGRERCEQSWRMKLISRQSYSNFWQSLLGESIGLHMSKHSKCANLSKENKQGTKALLHPNVTSSFGPSIGALLIVPIVDCYRHHHRQTNEPYDWLSSKA